MNNNYVGKLEQVLMHVRPRLRTHRLEFKNCFGAVAGYVDGRIFVSCGKFGVALRVPPETLTELFRERDVQHLRYFPKGHVKKEYAVIPQRILDDQDRSRKLLAQAVKYALGH